MGYLPIFSHFIPPKVMKNRANVKKIFIFYDFFFCVKKGVKSRLEKGILNRKARAAIW